MIGGCGQKEAPVVESVEAVAESISTSSSVEEEAAPEETATPTPKAEAADPSDPAVLYPDEGKTLNILCWNDELRVRMETYYPLYERVSDTEGTIGGVTVCWIGDENAGAPYATRLTRALSANADAETDEKIDLFLAGPGEAPEIAASGNALSLADLGIGAEETDDQFPYTRSIITDVEGHQRGAAWQACPGVMIYRRDMAEEVLGSADPEEVQKQVATWEAFLETAAGMKAAGYRMTATTLDTFRAYTATDAGKWVQGDALQIAEGAGRWVEDTMTMASEEQTGSGELWSYDWEEGLMQEGKVFCYFGPAWLFENNFRADEKTSVAAAEGWAICNGPQSFFWSGIWICAAKDTDNPSLAADVIRALTIDPAIMEAINRDTGECVNAKSVMAAAAADPKRTSAMLGGQNPYGIYAAAAEACPSVSATVYDAICEEEFQTAMNLYFDDVLSYEEAVEMFAESVAVTYPHLKAEGLVPEEEGDEEGDEEDEEGDEEYDEEYDEVGDEEYDEEYELDIDEYVYADEDEGYEEEFDEEE